MITTLFRILVVFEVFWGGHAWFTWWCDSSKEMTYAVFLVCFLLSYLYKTNKKIRLSHSHCVHLAIFFYVFGYWAVSEFSLFSLVGCMLQIYPIWVALSDKENTSANLNFVVKCLSWILVPGIILYAFWTVFPIPSPFILQYSETYTHFIYIFFIEHIFSLDKGGEFARFYSVFLEPGYLSAVLVFLLYARRFDFKNRYNRILLYGLITSFSLAGYILAVVGYFLCKQSKKISLKPIFALALVLVCVYFGAIHYNGGNNIVNELIIERLQPDKEKGISGYNRTTGMVDQKFKEGFSNGNNLFGLGQKQIIRINGAKDASTVWSDDVIGGAGYKLFIVTSGLIPALCFLLFYYYMATGLCYNKRYGKCFVLIIVLTFLQAAYPMSPSWIYPFLLGVSRKSMY